MPVPMEKSLDANGCYEVRRFFGFLLNARKKIGKVPVNKVLEIYSMALNGRTVRRKKNTVWTDEMVNEVFILAQRRTNV